MSATIGAALKKLAVGLALDKRNWDKIVCLLLAIFLLVLAPGAGAAAVFEHAETDFDTAAMTDAVMANLSAEDTEALQFMNDTGQALHEKIRAAGGTPEQCKAAEVLFVLALFEQSHEPGFVDKLAGCFTADQTDEQLIAAVNTAFGTTLTAEEFTAIMTFVNNQIVEIAKTQLGNVGGQPYWSWYGFGSRVEWCACFVSWCADRCGYIDKGLCPKFAGCTQGAQWFKNRRKWLAGSGTPSSGMIVFFDWDLSGDCDHVGMAEQLLRRMTGSITAKPCIWRNCGRQSFPGFIKAHSTNRNSQNREKHSPYWRCHKNAGRSFISADNRMICSHFCHNITVIEKIDCLFPKCHYR